MGYEWFRACKVEYCSYKSWSVHKTDVVAKCPSHHGQDTLSLPVLDSRCTDNGIVGQGDRSTSQLHQPSRSESRSSSDKAISSRADIDSPSVRRSAVENTLKRKRADSTTRRIDDEDSNAWTRPRSRSFKSTDTAFAREEAKRWCRECHLPPIATSECTHRRLPNVDTVLKVDLSRKKFSWTQDMKARYQSSVPRNAKELMYHIQSLCDNIHEYLSWVKDRDEFQTTFVDSYGHELFESLRPLYQRSMATDLIKTIDAANLELHKFLRRVKDLVQAVFTHMVKSQVEDEDERTEPDDREANYWCSQQVLHGDFRPGLDMRCWDVFLQKLTQSYDIYDHRLQVLQDDLEETWENLHGPPSIGNRLLYRFIRLHTAMTRVQLITQPEDCFRPVLRFRRIPDHHVIRDNTTDFPWDVTEDEIEAKRHALIENKSGLL